jgi:hypothetical protein
LENHKGENIVSYENTTRVFRDLVGNTLVPEMPVLDENGICLLGCLLEHNLGQFAKAEGPLSKLLVIEAIKCAQYIPGDISAEYSYTNDEIMVDKVNTALCECWINIKVNKYTPNKQQFLDAVNNLPKDIIAGN